MSDLMIGFLLGIVFVLYIQKLLCYRPAVFVNGLRQTEGVHFFYNALTRTITFIIPPTKGDVVSVVYERSF